KPSNSEDEIKFGAPASLIKCPTSTVINSFIHSHPVKISGSAALTATRKSYNKSFVTSIEIKVTVSNILLDCF
ncbi:MAG: hypothetical protein ACM3PP_06270, partial [Candidatus Saccharibacteria bacterium]